MISLTLHGHPEKGQDTIFSIEDCQRGDDPAAAPWEREVIQHAFPFHLTAGRSIVTTLEMVNEMMDFENATTDQMLRALGWSEADLDGTWDAHRTRTEAERVQRARAHAVGPTVHLDYLPTRLTAEDRAEAEQPTAAKSHTVTYRVPIIEMRDGDGRNRSVLSFRCPKCRRKVTRRGGRWLPLNEYSVGNFKSCPGCRSLLMIVGLTDDDSYLQIQVVKP